MIDTVDMLLYASKTPHRLPKVYTARSLEKAHQVTYWLRLCNGGNCVHCANVTFYDVQRHCDCFLASWRSSKSKVNGGCCNSAAANKTGFDEMRFLLCIPTITNMNNLEKYNHDWDYLTPEKDSGSSRTCSGSLEARPFDQQLGEEDPAAWWYFDSLLGIKFNNENYNLSIVLIHT